MSSGSVRKFLPSLKLKLGTKTVICAIVLIAMNTGLVVGAAYWSLTSEFNARALRDIEANLRTLAMTFSETYSDAKIVMKDGIVARAEIAKMPEFKDHAIVDRAVSYVGGNATLFVYDDASNQFVRRSTNLKKENGDRADRSAVERAVSVSCRAARSNSPDDVSTLSRMPPTPPRNSSTKLRRSDLR